MSKQPLSDTPAEEEFDLYRDLEKKGIECGLFDPDFDDPHECTLHIERHFSDNTLRLECEDCSLDLTKPTSKIQTAMRDGVGGGYGLVLLEIGSSAELRVLVLQSDAERQWLACVFNRLAEDHRAYRRAQPLLGCFPAGSCACLPRRRKQSKPGDSSGEGASSHSKADSSSAESKEQGDPAVSSGSNSFFWAGHKSPASGKSDLPEAVQIDLKEVKAHARKLWDDSFGHGLRKRPSFSEKMMRASFTARTRRGSESSIEDQSLKQPRTSLCSASGLLAETTAGAEASGSNTAPKGESARLDGIGCTHLLLKMLSSKAPRMPGSEAEEAPGGPKLFQNVAADPSTASRPIALIEFEEFWAVCKRMMMVEHLLKDPEIEKRIKKDPATNACFMDHEKWEWFLVQVQGEKPEKQLATLEAPELNAEGYITLYGLSRFLCSEENSILEPERSKVHQDMTQPLTSYWIASSHHVYADAATEPVSPGTNGSSRNESPLDSISRVLRCNCRCLSLALVLGGTVATGDSSSSAAGNELHVLLQQQRVPLMEVLAVIEEQFSEAILSGKAYPLLLVISLGMLPRPACADVPQALRDGLGDRLWRNSGPELPSPQDAMGHVIVILSPAAPPGYMGADPSLKLLPPPALAAQRSAQRSIGADDVDPLLEWQEAATCFAVWPGQPFDARLPQRSALEVSVSFLPLDELQVLEEAKTQPLIEYHRQYLTLAFNVAPRCAQVPFNPASAWSMGIQMVAVPAGVAGDGSNAALVHAGRFVMDNGNSGYVLKPPHLQKQREEGDMGAEFAMSTLQDPKAMKVQLRIIVARAVPGGDGQAGIDGHITVAVAVWGSHDDCNRKLFQFVRPSSSHVVDWLEARSQRLQAEAEAKKLNDQGKDMGRALKEKLDGSSDLVSFNVSSPSSAIITIELIGKSRCLGAFAAPLNGLRSGIRWVPLWMPGSLEESPTEYGSLSGLLMECKIEARKKGVARKNTVH